MISVTSSVGTKLENENAEAGRGNTEDDKEYYEENIAREGVLDSSTATIASTTTSQTSSSGSRKSRRASVRREKLAQSILIRSYDPMQVVTPEQLTAFSLLVSTPIWIFDFVERKNRYANPAGLDLWSASSLDEFLNRNMNDMSAASVVRTQECQNRVEKAQVVQDMWTFYPKGKAKTVQMTMTAVRLSPDEDHCSILVVGNMITPSSSISNSNFSNSRSSISGAMGNIHTFVGNSSNSTGSDTNRDSDSRRNKSTEEDLEESATTRDSNAETYQEEVKDEPKRSAEGEEKEEEKEEDDTNSYGDEMLDNSNHTNTHHHQMTAMDGDNPLNQEILRGVEIIRHLPIAVCQFDMKGRLMFQNPAAYLPPLDDEEEKEIEEDESYIDDMDTDDDSEYYEELFDQQFGGVQTISSNNGRGNFMDRFVNKKVARELLESLQDKENAEKRSNSITSTSSTVAEAFCALGNTATVSIEAELYTSTKGRTQWSSIQLRKTKDPVTSRPVILYSAQDKSDAMEAKREREARMQKSEFLAIMAHEIRTPLHQVTGFIDLLELEACQNPITTTASSSAINTTTKNKTFKETDSSIKNALFPSTENTSSTKNAKFPSAETDSSTKNALFPSKTLDLNAKVNSSMDRPKNVKKSRSTSLINTRTPTWSIPRQAIGNLTGEQRGYIKLLKSSANQLMTVINDVLDYSKLEAGKMKTERIPFELLSVVQGSMEAVRGNCEEKGLTLTLEYGGSDDDEYDDGDDVDDKDGSGVNSGNKDRRKTIRRRRSFDGKANKSRSPGKRKIGRTHSFNNKNKKKSDNHPNIKSNDIPFRILGDPNRLRQVLLNLLSNAVKFTEKGGIHVRVSSFTKKVTVPSTTPDERRKVKRRSSMSSTSSPEKKEERRRVARRSSMSSTTSESNSNSSPATKASKGVTSQRSLRIVVTDTGMGISKEQQNTIFEKYQQANLSVARNFGGTGLGLSICKLLVEQTMSGTIGVDSDLGHGSSFIITLPIEVPREISDDTSRGVNGGEENQKNAASLNVLVAEDNKINQKLVANMLKRMGHKSTLVENGRQAIDVVVKQHGKSPSDSSAKCIFYDAVLMDIQMPVMDGLEATRRLRTMGYTDLPILGLTASVKRSDYEELGFTDWLPKPILMKDLKAKLLKLCSNQAGEDSDESITAK